MGIVAVKPAFANGRVCFCLLVVQVLTFVQLFAATKVAVGKVGELSHRIGVILIRYNVPLGFACVAGFVAAPAYIFAAKNYGLGCQFMNQLFPCRIVIGLSAFGFGVGSVEPYFMYGTVFGQNLEQLIQEVFVIVVHLKLKRCFITERSAFYLPGYGAFGIFTQVAVQSLGMLDLKQIGRREVNSQLQSVLTARFR